jgi:hypothetical protein
MYCKVLGLTGVYNNAFISDLALVFSFKYSHLSMYEYRICIITAV